MTSTLIKDNIETSALCYSTTYPTSLLVRSRISSLLNYGYTTSNPQSGSHNHDSNESNQIPKYKDTMRRFDILTS